jgi:MoxR-like ATPase
MNDDFLNKCVSLKPKILIISDLKWKYLMRAIMRQKNILLIGESGTAKTLAARCAAEALHRPIEIIHCGSSQDARATLIGNTTYKKELGTIFHKSVFVKAITTENNVILLDELSRATHDAINILMPVIDPTQRTLRLDEDEDSTLIKVAKGVMFIATANIGNSYTATKVLDKAILRRFPVKLEMDLLDAEQLEKLFSILFSSRTSNEIIMTKSLASISDDLISQCNLDDAKISTIISPANMVEIAELVMDGFSLEEIAETAIYPEYPDDGGADSERTFVKSILQKYFPKNVKNPFNDPLMKS